MRDSGQPVKLEYFSSGTERVALCLRSTHPAARANTSPGRPKPRSPCSRASAGVRASPCSRLPRRPSYAPLHHRHRTRPRRLPTRRPAQPAHGHLRRCLRPVRAFNVAGADRMRTPHRRLVERRVGHGQPHAACVRHRRRAATRRLHLCHTFSPLRSARRTAGRAPSGERFPRTRRANRRPIFPARHAQRPRSTPAPPDLAPIFRAIAEDLQSQYMLGYYLDDAARQQSVTEFKSTTDPAQRRTPRASSA